VVATIDNHGIGAGTIMGIYSIVVTQVDADTTEVSISAVHLTSDTPLDGDYFCNVTIIGTSTGRRHKV
jgi:hypothetical protein